MLVFAVALVIYGVFNMDSVVGFIGYVVGLLRPFLIGVVIAFILNVPLRLFEQRVFVRVQNPRFKKMERGISILLSIVLVWAILGLIVSVVLPQLASSLSLFISAVPSYIDYLINFLSMFEHYSPAIGNFIDQIENFSPNTLENHLTGLLNDQLSAWTSVLSSAVVSTVSFVSNIASSVVHVSRRVHLQHLHSF